MNRLFDEQRGQGSLEYLLIAGGAIVLAALAIFFGFRVLQKQSTFQEGSSKTGLDRLTE